MESELAGKGVGRLEPLSVRLADGDPAAPRELVERHYAELYRYARVLMRDATGAEDAVQEALGKAFAALGGYSRQRIADLRLRPWLYRITLNVVRNSWRAGDGETSLAESLEIREPPGPEREPWMDALRALELLPQRQRIAVVLRYLEDLPYSGIAEATGWPENTCKTLVHRGIKRLGTLLDETDGSSVKGER